MNIGGTLLNIATLGTYGNLQSAKEEYSAEYSTYYARYKQATILQDNLNAEVVILGQETVDAFQTLRKSCNLITNQSINNPTLHQNNRIVGNLPGIAQAKNPLANYHAVSALAKGGGAGVASVVGTWSFVSLFGVASTGTPIAALYGVASTNATLAFFGGGALAAGGAGMAGGMVMLTGIALIPAVFVSAFALHKKAEQVVAATEKIRAQTSDLRDKVQELVGMRRRLTEQRTCLNDAHDQLRVMHNAASLLLFPYGFWSKIRRCLRVLIGKDYFEAHELRVVSNFDREILMFTKCFETGGTVAYSSPYDNE